MPRTPKPFRKGNFFYTDIGGKRTKLGPISEGEKLAKDRLRHLLRKREDDGGRIYQALTVATMFAHFLQTVEAVKSPHTFADYQRWLTDFALLHGNRQVGDIARIEAENFRSDLTKRTWTRGKRTGQPYKAKTINHAIIALKRAWNWAIDAELIPAKNPFARIPLLHAEGRKRLATEDEYQRLFDNATDDCFRDVLVAMRYTPSRPSYIRILTWDMVDWDKQQWTIWKTKAIKQQKIKKPHVIPMPPLVQAMLKKRHEVRGNKPFVFLNQDNEQWTKDALCLRMRRCRERAGIGPDAEGEELVLYSNRHTYLTKAAETQNSFMVQQLAGHSDSRTTERYVHMQNIQVVQAGLKTAESLKPQSPDDNLGK